MARRHRLSLPLQVLLWAGATSAAGAVTGLAVSVFREGGPDATFLLISVLFGMVVGLTVLISSTAVFPRLRGFGPLLRGALLVATLLSGSLAGTAIVLYLFPLFVLRDLRQTVALLAINGVLALIVGSVAYVYEDLRSRLAETLREVEDVRLVEARLREETARAELSALQARINPHFFFNTLNTISSLLDEDPERAGEIVQTLADLFRYTLKASDAKPVPLAEELAFVEAYLALERARFGNRLRVESDIAPEAFETAVPGLILQPLVENAVAHGIAPVAIGGTVRIVARVKEGMLRVEVSDDGAGLGRPAEQCFREGHGLANILGRLNTLYGSDGHLELRSGSGGRGTLARVRLPCAPPGATGDSPDATASNTETAREASHQVVLRRRAAHGES